MRPVTRAIGGEAASRNEAPEPEAKGRTEAGGAAEPGELASRRIAEASRQQELRDPDEGLGRLGRIVNKVAEVVGVAALGTIVAVIFANAVGRYAFNSSLIWAEELVPTTAARAQARHDRGLSVRAPGLDDPHRLLLRQAAATRCGATTN